MLQIIWYMRWNSLELSMHEPQIPNQLQERHALLKYEHFSVVFIKSTFRTRNSLFRRFYINNTFILFIHVL